MKIAFCGKGGVGKTTLASLLIRFLVKEGIVVLAVDADPACSLAAALDFPQPEKITPIAQMQELIQERMGAQRQNPALFKLNPTVNDIPAKYLKNHQGIKLIVMGSIEKGGSGCACPASTFLKVLLSHILLNEKEVVVMDMEAGLEHLGRATSSSVDFLIIVLEPNQNSLDVAKKIYKLAGDIKIKNIVAVANKIKDQDDLDYINKNFKEASPVRDKTPKVSDGCLRQPISNGVKIIGQVKYHNDILLFSKGKKVDLLKNKQIYESIKEIKDKLMIPVIKK